MKENITSKKKKFRQLWLPAVVVVFSFCFFFANSASATDPVDLLNQWTQQITQPNGAGDSVCGLLFGATGKASDCSYVANVPTVPPGSSYGGYIITGISGNTIVSPTYTAQIAGCSLISTNIGSGGCESLCTATITSSDTSSDVGGVYSYGFVAPTSACAPSSGPSQSVGCQADGTECEIDVYNNNQLVCGYSAACSGDTTPTADPPNFSIKINPPTSQWVYAGSSYNGTANYAVEVDSLNGMTGTINLSSHLACPSGSTCSVSPTSVTLSANGTASAVLTIATTVAAINGSYGVGVNGVWTANGSSHADDSGLLNILGGGCGVTPGTNQLTGCGYTDYQYSGQAYVGVATPGPIGTPPVDNFVALDQNYGNGEVIPGSGITDFDVYTAYTTVTAVWTGNFNFSGGNYFFTPRVTGLQANVWIHNTEDVYLDGSNYPFASVDAQWGPHTFQIELSPGVHTIEVVFRVVRQETDNYNPVGASKSVYLAWTKDASVGYNKAVCDGNWHNEPNGGESLDQPIGLSLASGIGAQDPSGQGLESIGVVGFHPQDWVSYAGYYRTLCVYPIGGSSCDWVGWSSIQPPSYGHVPLYTFADSKWRLMATDVNSTSYSQNTANISSSNGQPYFGSWQYAGPNTGAYTFGGPTSFTDSHGVPWQLQLDGSNNIQYKCGTPVVINAVSVTPSSGSSAPGQSQTFHQLYTDSNGSTDISQIWTLLNPSTDPAPNQTGYTNADACYIRWDRSTNSIFLLNDAGTTWSAGQHVGSGGVISNSRCSVNPAASNISDSGNNLVFTIAYSFTSAFVGTHNHYMFANNSTINSGWQQRGAWTVTSASAASPSIQLSPLTLQFSGTSGDTTVPASQTLTVSDTVAGTTLKWKAQTNQDWCRVNGVNKTGSITGTAPNGTPATISVSVDLPSQVGAFNCTIAVYDNGSVPPAGNSPQTASVVYTVSGASCPSPASNLVNLNPLSIATGETSTASAPSGFSGGTFSVDASGNASISGNTITGVSAGSDVVSGSGWTYTSTGATSCSLGGRTLTISTAACTPLTYNHATSGFSAITNSSGPSAGSITVNPGDTFYAYADYGAKNDAINPPDYTGDIGGSNACSWNGWVGSSSVARFVCAAQAAGSYSYVTHTNSGTADNICGSSGDTIGTVTVNSPPSGPGSPSTPPPSLNNNTCGNMTVTWTPVNGATTYNIYRTDSGFVGTPAKGSSYKVKNGATGSSYTDTTAAGLYNYWVSAVNAGGESALAPANNPSQVNACTADLGTSDKDIVSKNGTPLSPVPNSCNSGTDPVPNGTTFSFGDVISFSLNICNGSNNSNAPASGIVVTDNMVNMQMPTTGWNAKYKGAAMVYDGGSATNQANHYYVSGTAPNQVLTFNIPGSVIVNDIGSITYDALIKAPDGTTGSTSRFQNTFVVSYNNGSGQTATPVRRTPLIPFTIGSNVPDINETR